MKIATALIIPLFILLKVFSQNFIFSDDFNQPPQLNCTVSGWWTNISWWGLWWFLFV